MIALRLDHHMKMLILLITSTVKFEPHSAAIIEMSSSNCKSVKHILKNIGIIIA